MYVLVTAPKSLENDRLLPNMTATIKAVIEAIVPKDTVVIVDVIIVDVRVGSQLEHANNEVVHGVLFHGGDILSEESAVQELFNEITAKFDGWKLVLKDAIGTWSANGVAV